MELIGGKYYWIKVFEDSEWEACKYLKRRNAFDWAWQWVSAIGLHKIHPTPISNPDEVVNN